MTDAGLTIFHVLPQSVSLIADSWILREAGIIIAFVRYPLFMMEMSLVLALFLAKLVMILRPCNYHSNMLMATKIISPLIFFFFLIIDYSKIFRCSFNDNISCYSHYKPAEMFLQNRRQIWWLTQDNLRIDCDGSSYSH